MKLFFLAILFSFTCILSSCGKGIAGGPGISLNPILSGTVSVSLIKQNFLQPFSVLSPIPAPYRVTTAVGANTKTQLKSLKYYFIEVQICKDLTTTGTAYNNPSGCISLYKGSDSGYNTYLAASALADTDPSHYVDIVDMATTKAKLNQGLASNPGEYNYGVITWYRPLKVKAEVTLNDNTVLVTKPGTETSTGTDANGFGQYYTEATSLSGSAGTSEEAIVTLNNGGNWFKFQNTFKYDGTEPMTLDLVFNPESIIKGSSSTSNYSLREPQSGNAAGKGLNIPALDLSPVVHKASETTKKESYLIHASKADIRLELYYINEDTAKTIYGADIKSVYTASTSENVMDPGRVSFIQTNANATLDFQDYAKSAMISGFARLTTEGQTGSVTLKCSNTSVSQSSICADSTDVSVSYELSKIVTVQ